MDYRPVLTNAPLVTVVVPILNDAHSVATLLAHMPPQLEVEISLVDGGYDDELDRLAASRPDVHLIRTTAGRARQMNAGARDSSADWLLFLHADSRLPARWLDRLKEWPSPVIGGWFRFALDDDAWQARIIERAVALRVRLFRLPYGDQGIFVRRRVFDSIGGYRDLPIMEDVEFVRRLTRMGPVAEMSMPLKTSSRRWRRDGWVRRSARNVALISLYFLGVSPMRLARWR